jgi:phospholipid/cholesterol/gamma-HCH transport system substrate-binding protein
MSYTVRVGIFVVGALAVLGYFILRIEDLRLLRGDERRVEAIFDSVAGLDDKAAVRVAGVRVGRVDGIRLEGQRAHVTLLLEEPVELRQGAEAAISNMGLLGDKYVELRPGREAAPLLAAEEPLPGITPLGWDQAMARLDSIGGSIQETLDALDPKATGETFKRLLTSMEATVESIRGVVASNEDQVASTIANMEQFSGTLAQEVPQLARQMEAMLALVEDVVAENRDSLREGLSEFSRTAAVLRSSIDNLNSISERLAAGQGSIGKLLNSEEAHDQLVSTLDSVETGVKSLSDTLTRAQRIGLDLGIDTYYLDAFEDYRTSFNLTFNPDEERSYHFGLIDDPRGQVRRTTEIETVTGPDGLSQTTTTETVRISDKETVSAQVAFNLGMTSFRAGVFESSGGAAVDYRLFDRRFGLSVEAFDFDREGDLDPHLRLLTRWRLSNNVYVLGGYDDFLENDFESVFLGAGIRWSDDDLKYLLGSMRF